MIDHTIRNLVGTFLDAGFDDDVRLELGKRWREKLGVSKGGVDDDSQHGK